MHRDVLLSESRLLEPFFAINKFGKKTALALGYFRKNILSAKTFMYYVTFKSYIHKLELNQKQQVT